jgi:hypothetical protein
VYCSLDREVLHQQHQALLELVGEA